MPLISGVGDVMMEVNAVSVFERKRRCQICALRSGRWRKRRTVDERDALVEAKMDENGCHFKKEKIQLDADNPKPMVQQPFRLAVEDLRPQLGA